MGPSSPARDRAWEREQVRAFAGVRPRFVTYARTLEKVLALAARTCAPQAIVQTRAKRIASFAEKIQRKRELFVDAVRDMTDLCGARVITHTPDEVRAVCQFVEAHFEVDRENTCDVSQRYRPTEFGYRSVHYIASFRDGVFPTREVPVDVPEEARGLKAEIQVRTVLEHAWADVSHDLFYKTRFKAPANWRREFAAVAASLELMDEAFSRIQLGLRAYRASYGAYMTEDEMRAEMEDVEFVLEHDPGNAELAARVGNLALALGDWGKAVEVMSPHEGSNCRPLLRDLGVATCKLHRADPTGEGSARGRAFLEQAAGPDCEDADAIASLAGTWKGVDDDRARELYRRAFELDPSNPYPLGNYIELEVARRGDLSFIAGLRPVIDGGIRRCRDQISVEMNLPWAHYDTGKLSLLTGRPHEALAAYAKAVSVTNAEPTMANAAETLERLAPLGDDLAGREWAAGFLAAARAARFPSEEALARVRRLASRGAEPLSGPVLIVSGDCGGGPGAKVEKFASALRETLRRFPGTIVSGGTASGVSRLAGDVREASGGAVRVVGYAPAALPSGAELEKVPGRYSEVRRTGGDDFSPLEPVQAWIDIIASGVRPDEVTLLGVGGGPISAAEYRMALALGARVGVVEGSGRGAAEFLADQDWRGSAGLFELPADRAVVEAFLSPPAAKLPGDVRELIARRTHEAYRRKQLEGTEPESPSLARWENLCEDLRRSNLEQADDIVAKLRAIGCEARPADAGEARPFAFTADELERLSRMEHARWVVERLSSGWRQGAVKDVAAKTSPYLVAWDELDEGIRELDRDAVRRIPALLAEVGFEVRRP